MNNICPVCNKPVETKCRKCGFEMPPSDFLSEGDAKEWYENTVLPYKENWENRLRAKEYLKKSKKHYRKGD